MGLSPRMIKKRQGMNLEGQGKAKIAQSKFLSVSVRICIPCSLPFCALSLRHVRLLATSRTVAHQAFLSVGFFSGKNTEASCHFLLQGIFPTQGSNLRLLYLLPWQVDSLPPHHQGSPVPFYFAQTGILGNTVVPFCFLHECHFSSRSFKMITVDSEGFISEDSPNLRAKIFKEKVAKIS